MSQNDSRAEMQQGGRCVLGVHLDIDSLRMVEVSRGRIVHWASVPYPDGARMGSKEFPAFLKASLSGFHSGLRRPAVWVVGPLPSLQVRFLSLPKTRPRQMANLVYWTFRKEIPFDAAQTIFDYDVEGDISAAGQSRKVDATAYTVAQPDVDALVEAFERAGMGVDGVVIPSFALRNLFRNLPAGAAGPALGLHVGEEASSLLFYKGRHVVSHRVFKTGMNVVLDVLRDRHPDWSAAQTFQTIRAALAAADAAPEGASAGEVGEEAQGVVETVHMAFGRLIQQVERSMSAYLVGKSEEEIKTLFVTGSMAGLPSLVQELGSKLGVASLPMNLFTAGMVEGKIPPPTPQEGGMLAIALGAALSDPAHTPNLLHTYVKRMQEARASRIRMAGVVLGVAGLALLVAAGTLLNRLNRRLGLELRDLRTQIEPFEPYPDRAMIEAMVGQAVVDSQQMKSMASRSLPVAALNRLSLHTPADIRLTGVSLDRAADDAGASAPAKGGGGGKAREIQVHLEGMVLGPPGAQESKLAAYMLRLEDSAMFKQVKRVRSDEGREGGEPVLLFTLETKMDELGCEPKGPAVPSPAKGAVP